MTRGKLRGLRHHAGPQGGRDGHDLLLRRATAAALVLVASGCGSDDGDSDSEVDVAANKSPEQRRDLPTREGYDRWSAIYDEDSNPLVALEEPLLDRALGDVQGRRVLDLGCGAGVPTARAMASRFVLTGIDISVRPVNWYLAASSSIWYLSPRRWTSWTNWRAKGLRSSWAAS